MEFADEAVAQVAADAMHGYLMFGRRLIVRPVESNKKTMKHSKRKWTFDNPV